MNQENPNKLKNPEAYNHRDVVTLKPLTQWTESEEQLHLSHNRILQEGFATKNASEMIKNAKLAGEEWLTDICCPSATTAAILHLSKELVVNYKVSEEKLNEFCHQGFEILQRDNALFKKQHAAIEKQLEEELGDLGEGTLKERAYKRLERNKVKLDSENEEAIVNAAIEIEKDIVRKTITNKVTNEFVKGQMSAISEELNLESKTIHPRGSNEDFAFLGAAGSGKSTIAGQFLKDKNKEDYVILSTDNYRAFTIPGTEAHEEMQTKDV
ncbi:MAG: hypothetical protein EB127_14490 [Alphaproteobacteria bacterium]|nr:hypothetical protein [Alphaproteobacteria bacterium]